MSAVVAEIVKVALDAGGRIMVHAQGSPANVVAIGAAAALVSVSTGVGYGIYVAARELQRRMEAS
ncbi:hypothetical protein [Desulfococcus multivorans]|jgi:hypothetical protein|uniref:Uncharacterized protein n=1 Tax=Desulfococcus multivorans DSM 2059 TaxID=1121405 RepID=S7T793_DESML|nr:hypothetical protein [Desulfococcus multivorans]AOY60500.1 uncharacterized protein Dmul_37320 [Desulfococcus multivorans]AQV02599.1 hypothetical protein B2D07_18670 [Desulfococcus multivorans]EPR32451.1 hypothetical protein dsmv_3668 [Desulfococcus multivorans DSM 2059]SKA24472.1 hypothetical protein SAMN02745446_03478 [Desulfococcus multivorans DSM 2059]